ncbi:MAG TPA: M15 family metallopeptidase [Syntrophales bacterium]|nr:M15 family metallopeptidase [Syntrophales bacterium]
MKDIIDSNMTLTEAIAGTGAPDDLIERLCLIDVRYTSFDGRVHKGQLIIHGDVKKDIIDIFKHIEEMTFPLLKVVPIVHYDWSDDRSMADNNTSAFNYRVVQGTERLSNHAFGKAIDINPYLNPVIDVDGRIDPPGASYIPGNAGTLYDSHPLVREFLKRGWRWGGHFRPKYDYHHFDLPA